MFWTNMSRGGWWGVAAAVVAAGVLAGCGGSEPADTENASAAAPVHATVVAAQMVEWPDGFEAPGTVKARTSATLAARTMGYVREVRPNEGDHVNAGDVLVTLEARELQVAERQARVGLDEARSAVPEADSAIQSAQAQLQLAQTTFGRMQDLLNKRSVSQQEFDEAAARVRVARSAKDMAEARRQQLDQKIRQAEEAVAASQVQIEYLEVRAPFAGRVTARLAEPGILASPGVPLLQVERDGAQRLEVAVPEGHLRDVRVGQTVDVALDAMAAPVTGRVDEIVPEIDPASRTFTVKLTLPARAEIRSGLFGRASFATGTRPVLVVPAEAVTAQGQLRSVLSVEDGVARSRQLRVGESRDGQAEVLTGLSEGERVITAPAGLRDGQRVEVAP